MNSRRADSAHHIYLLDTMNNVLGILILVLLLTQVIGFGNGQGGGFDGVSPEAIVRLERRRAALEMQAGVKAANLDLAVVEKLEGDAAEAARKAEAEAISRRENRKGIAELTAQLAGASSVLADAEGKRKALQDELKQTLEQAGRETGVPAWDLTMSRPAMVRWKPEKTIVVWCRDGGLKHADYPKIYKAYLDARNAFTSELTRTGRKATWDNLADHLNAKNLGDDDFSLGFRSVSDGISIRTSVRRSGGWEKAADFVRPDSRFAELIAACDPATTLVEFEVWANSFDVYVAALRLAKQRGFRTHWLPYAWDEESDEIWPPKNQPPQDGRPVDP